MKEPVQGTAPLPPEGQQRMVPTSDVRPSRLNPRKEFRDEDLTELADSIRSKGLVQPIIVRPAEGGGYEIVAGERRWRAAQKAGLHTVPVIARDLTDKEVLELAIIENVQRADLNAIEEAAGYRELIERYDYSQEQLSEIIGKSRSHVANTLRLLALPDAVKTYVVDGKLTAGHARALLAVPDPEAVAREVVEKGLNVRAVEQIAQERAASEGRAPQRRPRTPKDADTVALERRMTNILGLNVSVNHRPEGAGSLQIQYKSLEQLEDVLRRLERVS